MLSSLVRNFRRIAFRAVMTLPAVANGTVDAIVEIDIEALLEGHHRRCDSVRCAMAARAEPDVILVTTAIEECASELLVSIGVDFCGCPLAGFAVAVGAAWQGSVAPGIIKLSLSSPIRQGTVAIGTIKPGFGSVQAPHALGGWIAGVTLVRVASFTGVAETEVGHAVIELGTFGVMSFVDNVGQGLARSRQVQPGRFRVQRRRIARGRTANGHIAVTT